MISNFRPKIGERHHKENTPDWPFLQARFPDFANLSIDETREALHAYSKVLGEWLKICRPARKHWWHAGLIPTIYGATTGIIHGDKDFSLELNFRDSLLSGHVSNGKRIELPLVGQPPAELFQSVTRFMVSLGMDTDSAPDPAQFSSNDFADMPQIKPHRARDSTVLTVVPAIAVVCRAEWRGCVPKRSECAKPKLRLPGPSLSRISPRVSYVQTLKNIGRSSCAVGDRWPNRWPLDAAA